MPNTPPPNGWSKYVQLVLDELKGDIHRLEGKVENILVELAGLKVKAGLWGLAGAAIPVLLGLAIWILRSELAG